MQEIIVTRREEGMRLDQFLKRYFPETGSGFLYRMLRKKNITLNGKKSDGSQRIGEGDVIRCFFSEETFGKLRGSGQREVPADEEAGKTDPSSRKREGESTVPGSRRHHMMPRILYETRDVIFLDKPAGLLSQKAKPEDISVNELLMEYLKESGELTEESIRLYRPAVCHRLDRNTSGVIAAGKTSVGAREMSALIRGRKLDKIYLGVVAGILTEPRHIRGYLTKDETTNTVTVRRTPPGDPIETQYEPLKQGEDITLLQIHLITGKPHQIRAHLAATGHPILGDRKYGDADANRAFQKVHPLRYQLLHAWKICFPAEVPGLPELAGACIEAPVPEIFPLKPGNT